MNTTTARKEFAATANTLINVYGYTKAQIMDGCAQLGAGSAGFNTPRVWLDAINTLLEGEWEKEDRRAEKALDSLMLAR